jgi:transcriptional regulator with XRE-family HTH domain
MKYCHSIHISLQNDSQYELTETPLSATITVRQEVSKLSDIGARMRTLREGIGLSQAKFGKIAGIPQATINRYETGYSAAPIKVLIWYADYFDVSMDYICCRTDKPQGKLYEYKPKILEEDKDMRRFVEMCFDPASPMNDRLKKAIVEMLEGVKE